MIAGYEIITQYYEGVHSLVYQAYRLSDRCSVILKCLKSDYPTPSELLRYQHEYQITQSFNFDGVIKAYSLEQHQKRLVIVFEDFGGKALSQIIATQPLTLEQFFPLAITLTDILGKIHQHNIIHKDINPANIISNPDTGQLKIIDFELASYLSQQQTVSDYPPNLEGTLAYMSPEQTGRMNCLLDYRSDYYSLGATFYELLTQQRPFPTLDPIELVHCHLAKTPIPPDEINRAIPQALSAIILKLLAKNAESRYQSAYGLKVDLETCRKQLQHKRQLIDFTLGAYDSAECLQIPHKLYGREQETAILFQAFERVTKKDSSATDASLTPVELVLVTGQGGIGKSVLVQELYQPIIQQQGYFIAGKFDQLRKHIPYSGIVEAFQSLIGQLLGESETQLARWRENLLTALGSNGQLIIDVIPDLELIIGSQPPVQPLDSLEAQNRFNWVFQQFVQVFSRQSRPLVLFLDDLQWADSASLNLLKLMALNEQTQQLLLMGAYRDSEINEIHPLTLLLDDLKTENLKITEIALHPLNLSHITRLVAETLSQDHIKVEPLAKLIAKKTGGNPFFINEFLKALYQDHLLLFNRQQGKWQWDIHQIEARGITDNVVELMVEKLKKLPPKTQQILQLAACVGNRFDLKTLSIIYENDIPQLFLDCRPALKQGIIIPISELTSLNTEETNSQLFILNYKFLHDRVQQAAYDLMNDDEKQIIHHKIGTLLLKNTTTEDQENHLFNIVEHLNQSSVLITKQKDKVKLAQLNLLAGCKAKDATAYGAAKEYLEMGATLLPSHSWKKHYQLAFSLYKELAEAEYLNGQFDVAESLILYTLDQTKEAIDRADLYKLLIVQYAMQGDYQKAFDAGVKGLALLGIDLSPTNVENSLTKEMIQITQKLNEIEISQLAYQPEMTHPEMQAAIKLLDALDSSTYLLNPYLFALNSAKQVNLFLQYGNSPELIKGYCDYGIVIGFAQQNYQAAYEFKKLGLALTNKYHNKAHECKILIHGYWIDCWVNSIKNIEESYLKGYQLGLESGELQYAGYNLVYYINTQFHRGVNLEKIAEQLHNFLKFTRKTKNQLATDLLLTLQFNLDVLINKENQQSINSTLLNFQVLEDANLSLESEAAWCYYYIFKAQILYLYGEFSQALQASKEAQQRQHTISGQYLLSEHNFYYSLSLLGCYSSATKKQQKDFQEQLTLNQTQLKTWMQHCPQNFHHKYCLIEAEIAYHTGQLFQADKLYRQGIELAKNHEFYHDEALAHELSAKFWLAQNNTKLAQYHITESYYGYNLWGAKGKVKQLRQNYAHLLSFLNPTVNINSNNNYDTSVVSSWGSGESIDIATLCKAAQAIASEIFPDKLLTSLIKTVLENAGAQKGFLLIPSGDGDWLIEAQGTLDPEHIIIQQSISLRDSLNYRQLPPLSLAIVNYVAHTKNNVVLNSATEEGQFIHDAYIRATQPKSILCIPLFYKTKLNGILYIENNITKGAFPANRVELLKLIAIQAAISLENSRLYRQLEDYSQTLEIKINERTLELIQANQELAKTLEQLKSTQAQIIAQEKLASLGALTAGIAHEIKNPLNFINNFAELVVELSQELSEEIEQHHDKFDAQTLDYINEMLQDISNNAQTINKHGKRADKIVQGMLMHSRGGNHLKQAVDINILLADSLNLAYHGLRAKEVAFNAKLETDYDDTIGLVYLVTQDINRVFLNIINNAGYAVHQKKQTLSNLSFIPTITLRTKNLGNQVEIRIRDNGLGIPKNIVDHIFNPFFTTKPPGEGTGLGLSISHDIVVQEHQGNLWVETQEGQYTEFVIVLPKN